MFQSECVIKENQDILSPKRMILDLIELNCWFCFKLESNDYPLIISLMVRISVFFFLGERDAPSTNLAVFIENLSTETIY